ncbi:hypothetical protein GRJ2_003253300 [Grus japonensis]|uniref:Uncharacterized protein n=1 Tax=Grus japonensis TaxID=30415 RepID=A0ABC9YDF5_GRUJA
MVKQAVPLQPMEDDGGAGIHLQPMEDPTLEQVDAPKGGCDPVGSLCWSKLLAGPVDPWREEPMLEQLECSRPRILCIPDSKTPGVDLESPLVLSARDSR